MANEKLILEIVKYSTRYEEELKRSGFSDDKTREIINKFVREAAETCSTNIDSSIKAFSFHNSLSNHRAENTMSKRLSIYRHR